MQYKRETKNLPTTQLSTGGLCDIRSFLTPEEDAQLEASIKVDGILQPLCVRKTNSTKFEVVDGNRRLRVALKLGLESIPCTIYENLKDNDAFKLAVVTNVARATLSARDQASAVSRYKDMNRNKTVEEIAIDLGMSAPMIRDYIYVAQLDDSIKISRKGVRAKVAEKQGMITTKTALALARHTARKCPDDLEARHKLQKELVNKTKGMGQRQRLIVFRETSIASKDEDVQDVLERVKKESEHMTCTTVSSAMYKNMTHFAKDRNLDLAKALRQLLLEGLRYYKYTV